MITMQEAEDGTYSSACGLTMKRESGIEENGRIYDGEWVLRDRDFKVLMIHNYRFDVASRMKLDLRYRR